MRVLGIETSCDETAAAVVDDGTAIRSNVVASQHDLHGPFGGVVPEIACRAHAERLPGIVDAALTEAGTDLDGIDGVAVTVRPGLIGALLVGLHYAKGLAWGRNLPLVGVDHLEAHLHAAAMTGEGIPVPAVALLVSGGHTILYRTEGPGRAQVLGRTRDDAAGEAFDKTARSIGLGYPGGPAIDRAAERGNPAAIDLPRARPGGTLDFSFSGLKTAVLYKRRGQDGLDREPPPLSDKEQADYAASIQEAVVDALVDRTMRGAEAAFARAVIACGGVACNRRLRARLAEETAKRGLPLVIPPPSLCTDNAAMIAGLGGVLLAAGVRHALDLDAAATGSTDDRIPPPLATGVQPV